MKKTIIALGTLFLALSTATVAVAASKTTTDVQTLATAESRVATLLHQYSPTPGWHVAFKAAVATQAADLARVNADFNPPKAHTGSSGTTYEDSNGVPYTVAVRGVYDPAQGAGFFTPDAGDRFVAVLLTITNRSERHSTSDDADLDASVIGSNDQTYTFVIAEVTECTNFDNGDYDVGPGASATGCVIFDLPTSVRAVTLQWNPGGL